MRVTTDGFGVELAGAAGEALGRANDELELSDEATRELAESIESAGKTMESTDEALAGGAES